jgi:hypothetical protein
MVKTLLAGCETMPAASRTAHSITGRHAAPAQSINQLRVKKRFLSDAPHEIPGWRPRGIPPRTFRAEALHHPEFGQSESVPSAAKESPVKSP